MENGVIKSLDLSRVRDKTNIDKKETKLQRKKK